MGQTKTRSIFALNLNVVLIRIMNVDGCSSVAGTLLKHGNVGE